LAKWASPNPVVDREILREELVGELGLQGSRTTLVLLVWISRTGETAVQPPKREEYIQFFEVAEGVKGHPHTHMRFSERRTSVSNSPVSKASASHQAPRSAGMSGNVNKIQRKLVFGRIF
jgi:hypothetical protein